MSSSYVGAPSSWKRSEGFEKVAHAAIVKLDDLGLALSRRENSAARGIGRAILATAPHLMTGLSIAGTIAMFLVGGGILAHGK